jgi:23S rRNA (uracil1939-C5)-methyltransferase
MKAKSDGNSSPLKSHPKVDGWQQGELLEITIADLNHTGDGVGRWQGQVIFVPNTVPGDRVLVRLVRVKPRYAHGKLHQLLEASPHRIRPHCIVADKCGGCQWQQIDYAYQLAAKQNLVIQDLQRIGGFPNPPVDPVVTPLPHPSSQASPLIPHLHYRNKATYPLVRSIATGQVQAGYYQKGSHELINLNQCPIQDERLNPLLAEVKQDIQGQGWSIYNETQHHGKLRHLGVRIGRRTGEMLLTLVSTQAKLPGIEEQANVWLERYPALVGVCININPDRTNAIFGKETHCITGRSYLYEEFAGLQLRIQPTTFFQVNTEQAETLLHMIAAELQGQGLLQGQELLIDAYCGIGTLTLPLAKQVQHAIGIEVQPESIEQAQQNAALNNITNVDFRVGAVEQVLPTLLPTLLPTQPTLTQPTIVLLDPPRKGCDQAVIDVLLATQPDRIVYVSCNPSTLARDLKSLCSIYKLNRVQPVDLFPQTPHVECVAFLVKP